MTSRSSPPRWVRPFVYGLLAVFLVVAGRDFGERVAPGREQETWPLTSWRLFSLVRTGTATATQVVTVDDEGREQPLDFTALGDGYRSPLHVVIRFPRWSTAQRDEVCRAWADAATADGAQVERIRIYRVVRRVPTEPTPPSERPLVRRSLRYECAIGSPP